MKHRVAPCAALVIVSTIAFVALIPAAESQQQAQWPGFEKVAQILNLTPQQRSQLAPILEAEAPKVQAIMQDPNLSPSEKKNKLKALQSQSDPLVKSILTPTQYKQWQQIRKDELESLKGGGQ